MENNINSDKKGAEKVEQSKNAHEIFDEKDDIPESKSPEEKKPEVKLERGEEVYKEFGFDEDNGEGTLSDRLNADSINIKRIEDLANTKDTDSKSPYTDYEKEKNFEENAVKDNMKDNNKEYTEEKVDLPLGEGVTLGIDEGSEAFYYELEGGTEIIYFPESVTTDPKALPQDIYKSDSEIFRPGITYNGEEIVNSDYELPEVYYTNTYPDKPFMSYNKELLRENDIKLETIPIKKQYKMYKPKKRLSKPMMLGIAAAVVGVVYYLTNYDD